MVVVTATCEGTGCWRRRATSGLHYASTWGRREAWVWTAASKAPINPPPMTMRLTGSLRERMDRVETCLVETKPQEAALLLESILFQLIFRPAPGPTAQETAGVIKQALAAVAEADLEKAAFYVSQAQPRL
jgi:hypothetical protein